MSGELLLELLTEEIPARMQRRAIEDLTRLVRDKLAGAEIPAAAVQGYVTPRRLTVIAEGIPPRQPDRREERRGPRVGAPQQALDGFLRAAGLADIGQCEVRDTGRGEFYFALIQQPGRATAEVLPDILHAAIAELPWPKSMRFPAAELRWVRPLNSVVCLFKPAPAEAGGMVVPLSLGDVPVGRVTRGHRFLASGEIEVADAADYLAKLEQAHVVLDAARRRQIIEDGLARLAAAEGLRVKDDPGLLDEVTGLVEWPVVLIGRIDPDSMVLPPEVLETAMRTHQKYFSCVNLDGSTAPRFLFVANNATPDDRVVAAGNERVLRARLADARFFWDQDRKVSLQSRIDILNQLVFNDKLGILGTMRQKAYRMAYLASYFVDANLVPGVDEADAGLIGNGAELTKADLVTAMVREFPELQGIMGRYYALHDSWPARIADAIGDHYKPLGPNDTCPTAPVSVIFALADKIDTLIAFFAIDERPTGSRDPYALRRAALGVIRLIVENNLRVSLSTMFEEAFRCLSATPGVSALLDFDRQQPFGPLQDPTADLLVFFADRLKVHLRERGVQHDLVNAVFALTAEDDIVRLVARVEALGNLLAMVDGANLLTAYRRASNIVRIEEGKGGWRPGEIDEALLRQPEERALVERLAIVGAQAASLLFTEKFDDAMAALATLRRPVDKFFDKVTVNVEDKALRENRLRLLSRIRNVMNQVADFSQIEG